MKQLNNIHLEGTENILKDFTNEDKLFIINIVHNLSINRPKKISKRIFDGMANKLTCTIAKAVKGANEVIEFYANNEPKGFKRLPYGYDLVSKYGTVLRFNRRVINRRINNKGYLVLNTYINNRKITTFVHRLVALTYITNPKNKVQVNHIDGNKLNNHVNNLEWVTNEENIRHATKTGLRNTEKMRLNGNGEKNSQAKIILEHVKSIRKSTKIVKAMIIRKLATLFKIDIDTIRNVLNYTNRKEIKRFKLSFRSKYKGKVYDAKWCCRDSEMYIRGYYNKELTKHTKLLSSLYNVSHNTIKDIVARRSWDYEYC